MWVASRSLLTTVAFAFVIVCAVNVRADDCADMDTCFFQVSSQCPPDVVVELPAQAFCSDRLAACKAYVNRCNQALWARRPLGASANVNITINWSQEIPSFGFCSDILDKCSREITGTCAVRGLGTPIATLTGGNRCPLEAICLADAKFCYCNAPNSTCAYKLSFDPNVAHVIAVPTFMCLLAIFGYTLM